MNPKSILKRVNPEWLILGVGAALRFLYLSMKPPHFDEGVNGWFVDEMTKTGFYHYDPTNYHGPLHFYVLFLMQTLLGRHIWALRLPMVLASLGTIWLALRFDRFLGRRAALWAALAMAVSPAFVFYARYAIHEYWLVGGLMLCAWGGAGLWQGGERKYLWAVWAGFTLAVLTKETYVIHAGCALLTFPCVWALGLVSPPAEPEAACAAQRWGARDMLLGAALFAGCTLFFYSGGFLDPASLKGLYQTYGAWFKKGKEGEGHIKAAWYWLQLTGSYEWPACAGVLAALGVVLPRTSRIARGLAIYGSGAFVAYSIIPYKTPWCIISILWPFLLLFGHGVERLRARLGAVVYWNAGALLALSLGYCVYLNFFHYTDPEQKYVYVQTYPDLNLLMEPLNKLVAENPANLHLTGNIVMDSYHPLPWLLGDFDAVGYYGDESKPDPADADFLLVESERVEEIEGKLRHPYFARSLHLRDAQDPCMLYLSVAKFAPLFPGRKPEFTPNGLAPDIPADASDDTMGQLVKPQ